MVPIERPAALFAGAVKLAPAGAVVKFAMVAMAAPTPAASRPIATSSAPGVWVSIQA